MLDLWEQANVDSSSGKGLGLFDAALKGKKLQMVACDDIGHFAAQALLNQDKFEGRAIQLAGDEISMDEAREAYARVEGKSNWGVWKAYVCLLTYL